MRTIVTTSAGLTRNDMKNVETVLLFLAKVNGMDFDDSEWNFEINDAGAITVTINTPYGGDIGF